MLIMTISNHTLPIMELEYILVSNIIELQEKPNSKITIIYNGLKIQQKDKLVTF